MSNQADHITICSGVGLVIGTCIGGATLVLPMLTIKLGLWITVLTYLFCAFLMFGTSLALNDVMISYPGHLSFSSMARATLGIYGQMLSTVGFLGLLYALLALYITGSSELIMGIVPSVQAWPGAFNALALLMTCVGGFLLSRRFIVIDRINQYAVTLLIVAIITLSIVMVVMLPWHTLSHVQVSSSHELMQAIPGVMTAFGFQLVLPTLHQKLANHGAWNKLRRMSGYGSLLACVVYMVWAMAFFMLLAHQQTSILALADAPKPILSLIKLLINSFHMPIVIYVLSVLMLCAIGSSFIGVALSLIDMLKDITQRMGYRLSTIEVLPLTMLPPLMMSIFLPKAFMTALHYAGFLVALLNGLMPCWMAFAIKRSKACRVPKIALIIMAFFCMAVMMIDLWSMNIV